jgi:hypothetical protein
MLDSGTLLYADTLLGADGTILELDQPISVRSVRPPLGLSISAIAADGYETTLFSGDRQAQNRPQSMSHRTLRGDGFADAGFTLARRIDLDYPDANLLDTIVFVGEDGSVAYEGRVMATPRTFDAGHSITYTLAGWMSHAKSRASFPGLYVDRDPSKWGDMPLNEKVRQLVTLSRDINSFGSWSTENGGLVIGFSAQQALKGTEIAEAWYAAPTGAKVGGIQYIGSETSLPAGVESARFLVADQDDSSSVDTYTTTMDGALHTASMTTARRFAIARLYAAGSTATPAAGANRRYPKVAVQGDQGLTFHPSVTSGEPDGLYISDVLVDIFSKYAPRINARLVANGGQVNPTTYPASHIVYDGISPYDAAIDLNKWHVWELGVYENRQLHYGAADLTEPADWQVDYFDQGVKVELQGDDTDSLASGIIVQYTDLASGRTETLYPDTYSDLLDDSVENPANTHGEDMWPAYQISFPCTQDDALQLGRAFLAELNQPKQAGTITVEGHLRDAAGHWQQAWKPRAGQTIAITNYPNSRPRLIVETDYDHSSLTTRIAVDSTFRRVDAFMDRVLSHMQPLGIG